MTASMVFGFVRGPQYFRNRHSRRLDAHHSRMGEPGMIPCHKRGGGCSDSSLVNAFRTSRPGFFRRPTGARATGREPSLVSEDPLRGRAQIGKFSESSADLRNILPYSCSCASRWDEVGALGWRRARARGHTKVHTVGPGVSTMLLNIVAQPEPTKAAPGCPRGCPAGRSQARDILRRRRRGGGRGRRRARARTASRRGGSWCGRRARGARGRRA